MSVPIAVIRSNHIATIMLNCLVSGTCVFQGNDKSVYVVFARSINHGSYTAFSLGILGSTHTSLKLYLTRLSRPCRRVPLHLTTCRWQSFVVPYHRFLHAGCPAFVLRPELERRNGDAPATSVLEQMSSAEGPSAQYFKFLARKPSCLGGLRLV